MALDEKKPCIWHAFNALAAQGKGSGVKTQLKVIRVSWFTLSCFFNIFIDDLTND